LDVEINQAGNFQTVKLFTLPAATGRRWCLSLSEFISRRWQNFSEFLVTQRWDCFCIVSILTLLLVPAYARVGTVFMRFVYSSARKSGGQYRDRRAEHRRLRS
jgi:hypothetical protein